MTMQHTQIPQHLLQTGRGSALKDLEALLDMTKSRVEREKIAALMTTLVQRERHGGEHLDSSYTHGLVWVLKREVERQQRSATP